MFKANWNSRLSRGAKTAILTSAVILTNVTGNLMLSQGMQQVGPTVSASLLDYLHALLNPWTTLGVVILALWMILNLALLSRADLSFVLPMTSCAYVIIAIAGHFLLGEHVTPIRWVAIVTVSIGAALAGETPPKTTPEKPEDLL